MGLMACEGMHAIRPLDIRELDPPDGTGLRPAGGRTRTIGRGWKLAAAPMGAEGGSGYLAVKPIRYRRSSRSAEDLWSAVEQVDSARRTRTELPMRQRRK